jgi:hypothetical protein
MADGLKTELHHIIGICGECRYSGEELMQDYPVGTGPTAVEATGTVVHGVGEVYLVVTPHRPTCSSHTNQKECL